MRAAIGLVVFIAAFLALAMLTTAGWEYPRPETTQVGYRGNGMVQVQNPRALEAKVSASQPPPPLPAAAPGGPPASAVFKNVHVLGDLNVAEFTRLMASITSWVAPNEGCAYCHAGNDLASDALYTKVVARRMLEMTRHINAGWKNHVGDTGVTCYTCHRGQPVPAHVWFADAGPAGGSKGYLGNHAGQNTPAKAVGLTALPYDPLSTYLAQGGEIRVSSTTALPAGNRISIQATEGTYGLMMHISGALGVNCTFCHNTRSFFDWDASTPQRVTAYHGIRMVRDLNATYVEPLAGQLPADHLGPQGDGPKVSCMTCHQGAPKPMYGANMIKDHPELVGPAAK
jgi:photosynthetic reaction center cytochrome c subunit